MRHFTLDETKWRGKSLPPPCQKRLKASSGSGEKHFSSHNVSKVRKKKQSQGFQIIRNPNKQIQSVINEHIFSIIKGMTKLDLANICGTSLVTFLLLQCVWKPQNETNKQIHVVDVAYSAHSDQLGNLKITVIIKHHVQGDSVEAVAEARSHSPQKWKTKIWIT